MVVEGWVWERGRKGEGRRERDEGRRAVWA